MTEGSTLDRRAWMVVGPYGAELETVRSTQRASIEKFCDREFHIPSAWAAYKRDGYRAIKVRVTWPRP